MPERHRLLSVFDGFLLWGDLSVSLLVIVAGAFLTLPVSEYGLGLSLPVAIGAIVAASVVGNLMLGLGGLIGADARVPAMVLLRAPLGRRGSYLPTALNVIQCFGWAIFEIVVIATAAAAVTRREFSFGGTFFWKLVFGGVATVLAFMGPVGFVHRYVRKFAAWIVLASLLYLCWWGLRGQHVGRLWHRGRAHDFWPGFDLALASIISWTPLVADYTRFSRTRAGAFWGTSIGYFVPQIPLLGLGAVIALSRDLSDAPGLLTAIAAGGVGTIAALLCVTVDESKEAFANVYSAAVSLQNILPGVPQRVLVAFAAVVSTVGALLMNLSNFQPFLYLLGSFFVPLFGVLLADWLLSGRSYREEDVFAGAALRLEMVIAWLAGFALYQWLYPEGPAWWTRIVAHTHPHALPWGGASLPSFAAAFLLAACARGHARRGHTRAGLIALIGNLSRDHLPGRPPHAGGGPFHGARALQRLRVPARIVVRCAQADRTELVTPVVRLGSTVRYVPGESTATFSIEYDGDRRTMVVEQLGDAWHTSDLPHLPSSVRWIHIAPLARSDFPARTLAALARRHRISFDGQGLVRVPQTGPLRLDADFDPDVLKHVWTLKLADEEAAVIGDVTRLPVRELLITHGSQGATLYLGGQAQHIPAHAVEGDPTGAGDAFMTAYVVARSTGFAPSSAARRATAVVASLLRA